MPQPTLPPDLLQALALLREPAQVELFLRDLLTPYERESIAERWAIVQALQRGETQRQVRDRLGCSITTVSRGAKQLKYGDGGFALALGLLEQAEG